MRANCPTRTIINGAARLNDLSIPDYVREHVHSCEKCRSLNHTENCLPYSVIIGSINLMPPGITLEQAKRLKDCGCCMRLLNDEAKAAVNRLTS